MSTQTATRLPSTRHLVCETPEDVLEISRFWGLSDKIALRCFMGEPVKMVKALARWAAEQDEPDFDLLEWAQNEGRGYYNPDPGKYQRNADRVPVK